MPEKTSQDQPIPALKEFGEIRNVLLVPFPEDLRDLKPQPPDLPGELPVNRQWKGPCLGYQQSVVRGAAAEPVDKAETRKKTGP